jgi:hypothetical protein
LICNCAVLQELARYEIDVRNIIINQLIFPEAGEGDEVDGHGLGCTRLVGVSNGCVYSSMMTSTLDTSVTLAVV